jgi:hypothetical protein
VRRYAKTPTHPYCRTCIRCRLFDAWWSFRNWWVYDVWRHLRVTFIMGRFGDLTIALEWKLADLWIGAFWRTEWHHYHDADELQWVDVWVCLVPCLPIRFHWRPWEGDEVPF